MRVICTIPTKEEAASFSTFLRERGVESECEEVKWQGKESAYRIWVVDEDQIALASDLYGTFRKNPPLIQTESFEEREPRSSARIPPPSYGVISKGIIVMTILLFLGSAFNKGITPPPPIPGIVQAPILGSPLKELIFDYPKYFELRDQLLEIYPAEAIKNKERPTIEAQQLIEEIKKTPFWTGIYDRFLEHHKNPKLSLSYSGPLFEKISKGQVWRVFTPALLHYDFLHILFNLMWFILLGNQIERKVGKLRYLLLILSTAIVANVLQYLMSGSFFMGLSGVVVGLAAFIWARQQVASWEGYLLQPTTLLFLALFIFGIFALQVIFFFLQLFGNVTFTIQIANTAHLMGGLVGYLCGRTRFFSIRK